MYSFSETVAFSISFVTNFHNLWILKVKYRKVEKHNSAVRNGWKIDNVGAKIWLFTHFMFAYEWVKSVRQIQIFIIVLGSYANKWNDMKQYIDDTLV